MFLKLPSSHAYAYLVVALGLFVAIAEYTNRHVGIMSEELMSHTSTTTERISVMQPDVGPLLWDASCRDEAAPATIVNEHRRPQFSLCFKGRQYPLVVSSYMSGYFYWPLALFSGLHHDNATRTRWFSIFLGVIDIILTFLVINRFGRPALAAATAVALAVSSVFALTHVLLVNFETLPWTFTMAALFVLAGSPALTTRSDLRPEEQHVPTSRLVAGAFFFGLAIAANIKAVFILAPILIVAWRLGTPLRRIKRRQWGYVLTAGVVPLAPLIWFALAYSHLFLSGDKSGGMVQTFLSNIRHPTLWLERTRDLLSYWSSMADYLASKATLLSPLGTSAIACIAFVYIMFDTVRTLVRGRGDAIVAACGLIFFSHIAMLTLLVSWFPYNYTPVNALFGIGVGCLLVRVAGSNVVASVTQRFNVSHGALFLAFTVALSTPFALESARAVHTLKNIPAPFNQHVEQELLAYLTGNEGSEGPVRLVSTENLLNGVVESLSEGRVKVTQAEDYIDACKRGGGQDESAREDALKSCYESRFRRLISNTHPGPMRVVVRTDARAIRPEEGSREDHLRAALETAAQQLDVKLELEATFGTPSGNTVLALYRVD